MLKFFKVPFAQSGSRTAVPDAADPSGFVSYTEGYGADYQRQKTDPLSKNIERDKMNELFFDATNAIGEIQKQGVPDFISTALNGGSPFSYAKNALVRYTDGNIYASLVASNTALPTDTTKWALWTVLAIASAPAWVDSIAALRVAATRGTHAIVGGYYVSGDGGGGIYYLDPSDTTSADNGGTIIVDSSGNRWKLTFSGTIRARQFGAKADNTTDNATVFAAAAAAVPVNGTLEFDGPGTFKYTAGLAFSTPVVLKRSNGAILNYTGTGNAVTLGPTTITTIGSADYGNYEIDGVEFTGGASMAQGIYVPSWVLFSKIRRCRFYRFGNNTAYVIFAQGQNWEVKVIDNEFVNDQNTARNFLRTEGFAAGSGYDSGNSHLTCIGNNISSTSGISVGEGISHTGAGDIIIGNKIEGFRPNIRSGSSANWSTIAHNYFEVLSGNCIEFGDLPTGRQPTFLVTGLSICENYCNMHATDGVGNTGSFVAPAIGNTLTGLKFSSVNTNKLANASTVIPIAVLNNVAGQIGNSGSGNTNGATHNVPYLRTRGSNLTAWLGEGPQILGLNAGVSSDTTPQVASASIDAAGSVRISGRLKATSTTIGANTILAFLPAGYFPSRQLIVPAYDASGPTLVYLVVSTAGAISIGSALTSSSLLDLNGVSFNIEGL